DHQIEHDADIRGAAGESAQALGANKLRLKRVMFELLQSRIKTFDVPDLEDGAMPQGDLDQLLCFFQVARQRFLDQDGNAAAQKLTGDDMMQGGGHGNDGGVRQVQERSIVMVALAAQAAG